MEAALVQGDLSQWPMDPVQVAQVIRVKFMQGPEEILNKFRELKVRAKVVKDVALAYVATHCKDLCGSPGVLRIHGAGINRIEILWKVSASSHRKGIVHVMSRLNFLAQLCEMFPILSYRWNCLSQLCFQWFAY